MKVGIATTFTDLLPTYSLATVVRNQLEALVKNGYEAVLLVLPGFNDDINVPEGVEVRKVVPQIIIEPYAGSKPENLVAEKVEDDVAKVFESFQDHFYDLDVVITHDWMLVDTYAPYAAALHLVENDPILNKKIWLHWVHSFPSAFEQKMYPWSEQYRIPKNHKIVYLNNYDVVAVAERYQGTLDDVRVVHNPIDPRTHFNFHSLSTKMIDGLGLLDCDIMQTYPLSTPRMESGKQVSKVIKIFSYLKKAGKRVKLVVANAHANDQREKDAIIEMMEYAESLGLNKYEVIFTSLMDVPEWEHGIPHDVVRDLFLISNLFIFPTMSENCPLILLEAASSKNLLVLNEDFAPLREFFGKDALYFKFSSLRVKTEYADEDVYFNEVAKIIVGELNKNRANNAFVTWKQKFNFDYIFKAELEPLFYEKGEQNDIPDESPATD